MDAHGDTILKGAFKNTLADWRKQGRQPPMLLQHGGWMVTDVDGLPVGVWESMAEDDHGLAVKGRLINLETERGKTVYGAMKEGALDGLSIGFRAKKFTLGTKPKEPRRTLEVIDLVEVSVCTFPANGLARVDAVKHILDAADRPSARQIEQILRLGGLPRTMAKAITARGLAAALADPDSTDAVTAIRAAAGQLNIMTKGLATWTRN